MPLPPEFYDDQYDPYRRFGMAPVAPPPPPPTSAPVAPPSRDFATLYGGGGGVSIPGSGGSYDVPGARGGGGGVDAGVGRPSFRFGAVPTFTPPGFTRPTMDDAMNEPGYQFRAKAGADALERSAAARGTLRTGGTMKGLIEHGQNFAAAEYANVHNRALSEYDRRYAGARDSFAPRLAQWQMLSQAELAAALAQYQQQFANQGGRGGGGSPGPNEVFDPEPEWTPGGTRT